MPPPPSATRSGALATIAPIADESMRTRGGRSGPEALACAPMAGPRHSHGGRAGVADAPGRWAAAGFEVEGDRGEVARCGSRSRGPGARRRGIVGGRCATWPPRRAGRPAHARFRASARRRRAASQRRARARPPGGHVPVLDRTHGGAGAAGLRPPPGARRATPGGAPRQAFFRMGEVILEVVQAPEGSASRSDPDGPARLWGLAFGVEDIAPPPRRSAPLARRAAARGSARPARSPRCGARPASARRSPS